MKSFRFVDEERSFLKRIVKDKEWKSHARVKRIEFFAFFCLPHV